MNDGRSNSGTKLSRLLIPIAFLAGVVQIALLWGTSVPLGVPGEWTWSRIEYSAEQLLGWLTCGIVGAAYLLLSWSGSTRIGRAGPWERAGWLAGLVAAAGLWVVTVVGAVPEPAGLGRVSFVLFYPGPSGYFWQARYEVTNLRKFLSQYATSIQDPTDPDNYLHIGTHPPGLTTSFVVMRGMCARWPAFRQVILATQPAAAREAFDLIAANSLASGKPIDEADEATLWLAGLIVLASIALAAVPIYLLVNYSTGNRQWAWIIATLWPLIPSLAIFYPKSDVLFPIFAATGQWLWLIALDRKSFFSGFASAFVLVVGMLLSLALLPVAAAFGLQTVFVAIQSKWPWRPVLGAFGGVLLTMLAVSWLGGFNLMGVWLQNVRNHAAFYDHNTRSYLAWLVANVAELAFSLGPVCIALLASGLTGVGSRNQESGIRRWLRPELAPVVIWLLLLLSGKNMGEAARLWNFLLPLLLWCGASLANRQGNDCAIHPRAMMGLLALQMATCVLTVTRVDGFQLLQ